MDICTKSGRWSLPSAVNWLLFLELASNPSLALISLICSYLCIDHNWRVRGMTRSSKCSLALYHSQEINYSNSNTSWTLAEPSEVPFGRIGTSASTSTIKIGETTIFFSAFSRTPPPTLGLGSRFRVSLVIQTLNLQYVMRNLKW